MKRDTKTLYLEVMEFVRKHKSYNIDSLSKELGSNWKTIDNVCNVLCCLGLVKVRFVGKFKYVDLTECPMCRLKREHDLLLSDN